MPNSNRRKLDISRGIVLGVAAHFFSQLFSVFCLLCLQNYVFFFLSYEATKYSTYIKKNINGHHLKKTYKEWCAAKHNATTNSVSQQRVF